MKLDNITQTDIEEMSKSLFTNVYSKYLTKIDDVVYDIGAFRGVLSKTFLELGYRVYAFEGSPINFKYLKDNIGDHPNVTLFDIAFHEREFNTVTRFNDCIGIEHPEQFIKYRTIDTFMASNNLPMPKLVKIDIEGMESVVLKQATNLIRHIRPIWQLSMHENHSFRYSNYPGFVPLKSGGFNFDLFSIFDYLIFDSKGSQRQKIVGFEEYIIIPKEKY
jgi:FkbM family methyltransferase